MKCKGKSCNEEAESIYIPRTLIGYYCIKTACQEEGWEKYRDKYIHDKLSDILHNQNMSIEVKIKHILKIKEWL